MDLRIFTEPQQGASYDDLLRVAKAAEDLGFDGFFRSDHYLKMGDVSGDPGPSDAWVTLAGLARDTSRIRLGTLVTPATFRLPGPLAISVAGVDAMSGGRVELGFGAGWFGAEHAAYGIGFPDVATRFDRFEEQLRIVHGLLNTPAGETFSFDGTHFQVTDSPALPKPVQSPLPIILGGMGKKRSAALAAQFADEFNVAFRPVADTGVVLDRVRDAAEEAGRTLVWSSGQTVAVGRDDAEAKRRIESIGRDPSEPGAVGLAGTPAQVVDLLGEFAAIGVTRMYLQVLDLADLDQLELIAAEVLPQV